MAAATIVSVTPVNADELVKYKLVDLFCFHGRIRRVALHAGTAFIDFERPNATASALMFDRTKFDGLTVKVAVVDTLPAAITDETWTPTSELAMAPASEPAKPRPAAPSEGSSSSTNRSQQPRSSNSSALKQQQQPASTSPAAKDDDLTGSSTLLSFLGLTLAFQMFLLSLWGGF